MGITFGAIDEDGLPLPHTDEWHQPNCAVGNQALVLRVLGYVPDPGGDDYGNCTAGDFYARVILALAVLDDDHELQPSTVGGNWHDCGRRQGYLIDKLHELREHAMWCAAHDVRVQWA
jgi:hypothetical protein